MKDDDCFIELFKLQKMFESSFNIRGQIDQNSIENVYNNDSVIINILLKPTDPDFDISIISNPDGIEFILKLYRISKIKPPDSINESLKDLKNSNLNMDSNYSHPLDSKISEEIDTYYELRDYDDITVNDTLLPDLFKRSIKKVLIDYITKNRKHRKYIIYESLKFLDKNLVKIYNISNSVKQSQNDNKSPNVSESSKETIEIKRQENIEKNETQDNPWTLEEQKCLEDGLVRSKGITDLREKWIFISKLVKTRSPEECRRRFIRCREILVKKNKQPETPKETEQPTYSLDKTAAISFTRLDMIKLSLGKIGTFSMDIVCVRCSYRFEVTMLDLGEKTVVYNKNCEKCNVSIRCEFTPSLFFPSQMVFGRLSLMNSDFIDINYAEFKLTCEDCETQSKIRDIKIGDKKTLNCRGCFIKFQFSFDGVQFGDQPEQIKENIIRKVIKIEQKKTTQPKGIKIGTPLPSNGTCKHYKKSFRWFRFPCCGRLFPCDVCHDDVSDHKCGHANYIICGYCSTQQPSSNKICKFCNKGYTGSSSSHWEGGKGCRDGTKLSRKDSKKYKLINKNNIKK